MYVFRAEGFPPLFRKDELTRVDTFTPALLITAWHLSD